MQYLSRPELFKQIHQHTDVRLALGWLSVFVAGGTGLYGYKVEFEQSKPVVWAGLILCVYLPYISPIRALVARVPHAIHPCVLSHPLAG